MMRKALYLITYGNVRVVTWSLARSDAALQAHQWIGGRREAYEVTRITNPEDRVHLDVTLQA